MKYGYASFSLAKCIHVAALVEPSVDHDYFERMPCRGAKGTFYGLVREVTFFEMKGLFGLSICVHLYRFGRYGGSFSLHARHMCAHGCVVG